MADISEKQYKKYRGNCHCGAYVFETGELPEIKVADLCNCSICTKKGNPWTMTKAKNVAWIKGSLESMRSYTFGSKTQPHKFCATCGTTLAFTGFLSPAKEGEEQELDIGLNIRCFQHGQVPNIWDMEATVFDGAGLGAPYEKPKCTGPEPPAQIDGSKTYTGSCHCGKVTLKFKSKPLDKTYQGMVFECNCSGCVRAAGCCAYPHKDQLSIQGEENTDGYTYGPIKAWQKYWCKDCGVFIGRRPLPLSEQTIANLPEEAKKWTVDMVDLRPVNLRIMDDVDLSEVKVTHVDGYNAIPIPYANP